MLLCIATTHPLVSSLAAALLLPNPRHLDRIFLDTDLLANHESLLENIYIMDAAVVAVSLALKVSWQCRVSSSVHRVADEWAQHKSPQQAHLLAVWLHATVYDPKLSHLVEVDRGLLLLVGHSQSRSRWQRGPFQRVDATVFSCRFQSIPRRVRSMWQGEEEVVLIFLMVVEDCCWMRDGEIDFDEHPDLREMTTLCHHSRGSTRPFPCWSKNQKRTQICPTNF